MDSAKTVCLVSSKKWNLEAPRRIERRVTEIDKQTHRWMSRQSSGLIKSQSGCSSTGAKILCNSHKEGSDREWNNLLSHQQLHVCVWESSLSPVLPKNTQSYAASGAFMCWFTFLSFMQPISVSYLRKMERTSKILWTHTQKCHLLH